MIYHVVPLDDWLRVPERAYGPPGAAGDSFVHCSPDEATALAVAGAFYRDAAGPLMVLMIDEHVLRAPVRWEPAEPAPPPGSAEGVLFPHVYGQVDRGAVVGMLEVVREPDGTATGLRPWS